MVYILSVSHMGFIVTVITNNKKCVRQKIEEGKFHSFNKASLQQTLMFQKKKKKTTPKQKQNKSYPGWPTPLAWSWLLLRKAKQEGSRDPWSPRRGEQPEGARQEELAPRHGRPEHHLWTLQSSRVHQGSGLHSSQPHQKARFPWLAP